MVLLRARCTQDVRSHLYVACKSVTHCRCLWHHIRLAGALWDDVSQDQSHVSSMLIDAGACWSDIRPGGPSDRGMQVIAVVSGGDCCQAACQPCAEAATLTVLKCVKVQ
jgi:hypothetical protein